jgi:hypothetical protein
MDVEQAATRARRTMARKLGASLLPYLFTDLGSHRLRITDQETGSWMEFDYSGVWLQNTGIFEALRWPRSKLKR